MSVRVEVRMKGEDRWAGLDEHGIDEGVFETETAAREFMEEIDPEVVVLPPELAAWVERLDRWRVTEVSS